MSTQRTPASQSPATRKPVVRHRHQGKPHALSSLLEPRALLEMALLPASLPLLMEAPKGDGHPVLLVPGFMAGETSLVALKVFLQSKGYDVHTWGWGATSVSQQACQCPAAKDPLPAPHYRP